MAIFAVPVMITPTVSQPASGGATSYWSGGIWTVQHLDVMMDNGSKMSTVTISLGIQLGNFEVTPCVGDMITIATGQQYLIDDIQPDGYGGAKLILKATQALLSGGY
jgi:hypothetical protein